MKIVQLAREHEIPLRGFLADFARAREVEIPAYFADSSWTHDEIIEHFEAWSRGKRIPEGWVPCTTSFLMDGELMLGVVNLRHHLTESLHRHGGHVGYSVRPSARRRGHGTTLLEAAMAQARDLQLGRLLVTCDPENVASIRVVEKCGGVLQDTIEDERAGGMLQRYWIDL